MYRKYTPALKKFSVFNNYLVKEHLALIEILFSDKAKSHATREFININDRVSTFSTPYES